MFLARSIVPLVIVDEATRDHQWLEGRTKLTKLVFLAQREARPAFLALAHPDGPYEFQPYHYGPFSTMLLDELEDLQERRLITAQRKSLDSEGRVYEYLYRTTPQGRALALAVPDQQAMWQIRNLVRSYSSLSREQLVRYIYEHYPDALPR